MSPYAPPSVDDFLWARTGRFRAWRRGGGVWHAGHEEPQRASGQRAGGQRAGGQRACGQRPGGRVRAAVPPHHLALLSISSWPEVTLTVR